MNFESSSRGNWNASERLARAGVWVSLAFDETKG
jgi:hypothetical protein